MAVTSVTKTTTNPPPLGTDSKNFDQVVKEQQAVKDINTLYDMKVGDAESINNKIKDAGLYDKEVNRSVLDSTLKGVYDSHFKNNRTLRPLTWGRLSELAEDRGWKQLDNEFMKIVNGDFSNARHGGTIEKLLTGKDSALNTANIHVHRTIADRLPQMKDHLKNKDNWRWSEDRLSIATAFDLAKATSWNNRPANAKEFMNNASIVADGKVDGIALLGQAVNEGWAGIKNTDQIATEYIVPGSNLDKLLGQDGARLKLNYGQLIDRVSHESDTRYDNTTNELTQHLSELNALITPDMGFASPGNDSRTVGQNLESLAKNLDADDPNSRISQISAKYEQVYADIKKLDDMGLDKSPAHKAYIENRVKDILKAQERTGEWFNNVAGFLNQAAKNIGYIKDEARKAETNAVLQTIFSGLAMLGSCGFGLSNGRALFGNINQWGKSGWKALNLPALIGSTTLFANNAVNTGISASSLERMKTTWKNIGMSEEQITRMKEGLANSRGAYQSGLDNMELGMRRVDYAISEKSRFHDYYDWAMKHQGESSIFGKGDDSAYRGKMPHKTWKTNFWKWQQGPRFNWETWWHFVKKPDWMV